MTAVCPCKTARGLPCSTSQRQMVQSKLQLARVRPSGLQATRITRSVCQENVCRQPRLSTSHSLTVPSKLALASCAPLGEKASPGTQWLCPASCCTRVLGFGASASHRDSSSASTPCHPDPQAAAPSCHSVGPTPERGYHPHHWRGGAHQEQRREH